MAKRSFSPSDVPEKASDYHGMAGYARARPDVLGQKGVKSLNLDLTLEEALKLKLALDSCLQAVNRYNRNTTKGRSMGVVLSIKTETSSITVIEAPVRHNTMAEAE